MIYNRKSQLIEQMKTLVVDEIFHSSEDLDFKWADYIGQNIHFNYKYLSILFSSVEVSHLSNTVISKKNGVR